MNLPEVNFLSVNTNYWRHHIVKDEETRKRQEIWLKNKLKKSREEKKKVLIGTHIPFSDCPDYNSIISPILEEYSDIISIVFAGHLHDLLFYVTEGKTKPYGNEIANQALTPQDLFTPGFTIYHFNSSHDGETFTPISFKQYSMQLTKTYNKTDIGLGLQFWTEIFDSKQDLGLEELQSQDFISLFARMKESDLLRMKFEFYNTNHKPLSPLLSFASFPKERGYLKVRGSPNWRKEHSWIYYWLFRSHMNPSSAPLIIFLEGGPGCASELQMLNGISPLLLQKNGELSDNPYSWNQIANLLIIDQPLGSGLSPVRHKNEIHDLPESIERVTQDMLDALTSFVVKYPEFVGRDTYFVANDYSFHVVSQLLLGNKGLGGLKLGGLEFINPVIDYTLQTREMVSSANNYNLMNSITKYLSSKIGGALCQILKSLSLTTSAEFSCKLTQKIIEGQNSWNLKSHNFPPFLDPQISTNFISYMESEIEKTTGSYPFARCSSQLPFALHRDILMDYTPQLGVIINLGLPITILFGERDLWNNLHILDAILKNSKWKYSQLISTSEWRDWKINNTIPAKFIKIENLKIIMVLDAGHYPLIHDPQLSFDIIANLIFA